MNREDAFELNQLKREQRLANLERKRTEDEDWDLDEEFEEDEDDA